MRLLISACLIGAALFSPVRGQSVDSEPFDALEFLRLRLNVPQTTAITVAPDATTNPELNPRLIPGAAVTPPGGVSHRVYIDVDRKELRTSLNAWVDQWNRKKGKKHGRLEVVADLSQADLILARYTGEEVAARGGGGHRFVRSISYVVVRKPEGFEVLWLSRRKMLPVGDPGIGLWVTFTTLLGAPLPLGTPGR